MSFIAHFSSFLEGLGLNRAPGLMLEVSLISGRTVSLQTHGDESEESLRVRAQRALGAKAGSWTPPETSLMEQCHS